MSGCPDSDQLSKFLAEPDRELSRHIDSCQSCQQSLEQLTDSMLAPPSGAAVKADSGLTRAVAALASGPIKRRLDHAVLFGPPAKPGDIGTLGSYQVQAEIGRGGMGVVYRAWDSTLSRTVAIKVLRSLPDEHDLRRFEREAQAAAQLRHHNVVQIFAADRTPSGLPYLVLEHVGGVSLRELIQGQGALSSNDVARTLAQAADGIHAANQKGLIHRDVKPANILLCSDTQHPTPDTQHRIAKVSDFGLVRHDNAEQTSAILAGTPAYMSPEQARNGAVIDARTDVYGLGATLYEALSGEPPFRGPTAGVIQQVLQDDPRPPRRINPKVPRDLEIICLKAMAKEPGRRYDSAKAFGDDLRRWQDREPIQARPASRVELFRSWVRRYPKYASLAASLILVTTLGIAGIAWQWRQAMRQRDVARSHLRDAVRAVDHFYTKISGAELDKPGLQPLRRELLQKAQKAYQEFLATWPDDPTLRVEAARATAVLADITEQVGASEEVIAAFQRAVDAYSALHRERPTDSGIRDQVFACQFHLANAQQVAHRFEEAAATYRTVRESYRKLKAENPAQIPYRRNLASCVASLGNCLVRQEKFAEAVEPYREALVIFRQLRDENPNNADLTMKLATTLTNLASCLPPVETLPPLQEARSLLTSLNVDASNSLVPRRIAKIDYTLGGKLTELGRQDEARQSLQTGIAILAPHVEANPAIADYRQLLAQLELELGKVASDRDDALKHLQTAERLTEKLTADDPASPMYQVDHARALAALLAFQVRNNNSAEVQTAIQKLIAHPQAAKACVAAAKVIAKLDGAKPHVMTLLRAAKSKGSAFREWNADPDFASLRDTPEFTAITSP